MNHFEDKEYICAMCGKKIKIKHNQIGGVWHLRSFKEHYGAHCLKCYDKIKAKDGRMNDVITDKYTLLYGDCLERMAQMGDGLVDLTVTSPPYDNLRTYEGSLEWGEHVWKPVMAELYRITKDGGVVVWVVGDATIDGSETGTSFRQALYAMQCGFNLHDTMIYNRQAMPNAAKRYRQDFEYMFILTKGKVATFNPIEEPCAYAGVGTSPTMRGTDGVLRGKGRRTIKDTKKRSNVWRLSAGGGKSSKDKVAAKHPAIFPEQLAGDHIISWSAAGDAVFDPFTGSGTTGKMALLNGRKFIGCEKVDKYFSIAEQRIADAANTLF